jgi:two-component system response regulator NreC
VETTRRIRAEFPQVRVLALSTHADRRYVQHMLDAGASGYVLKISAFDELLRAVRAVGSGKTYLSSEVAEGVVERAVSGAGGLPPSVHERLGSREREVLQLVAEGRTSAETAREMHISIKTVETHRRNIVQKLGLHGTAELTKYAIREGITEL